MADEEVATKAPESDAVEDSAIPNDSKAQEGPSMGEHCVTDRPTPAGEVPTGEMTKIAEVDVYVTKPADYPHAPSKLLLFLTGGTGVKSTNNQLQADKYAAAGFLVVMPDMFGGDPAPNTTTEASAEEQPSFLESVKLRVGETAKSFMIDMWLARQTPEKVLPLVQKVLDGAKEEFADAVANGGGVYGVGYCFGAKYILILAGEGPDTGAQGQPTTDEEQGMVKTGPQLKTGVIAHGTMITKEDIAAVKVPVCMVCVENDQLFPDETREEGKKLLEKTGIDHEVKVYPGVPHGFAVLGDYDDEKIKASQKDAFEQMLGWLQAH
ncbi:dienelactone hydrolase family protein-like protein [Rhizodiscina lignyota]|uniref:Dienelactone hydrolase family protein-like protein n=1 Tax=Rhizodiscina lignyota TaxID=1504668 RepID=A0A9P4M902_9PEZI|nr:dienelactone hydrolase family protein-like protein [Rhizodiscina lignyota]